MAVMMKGFAMKKVLKDGKLVGEKGIMGEYDGDIARIVEVSNGQAKYTELNKRDIEQLISMQASPKYQILKCVVLVLKDIQDDITTEDAIILNDINLDTIVVSIVQKNTGVDVIVGEPNINDDDNYIAFIIDLCSVDNK